MGKILEISILFCQKSTFTLFIPSFPCHSRGSPLFRCPVSPFVSSSPKAMFENPKIRKGLLVLQFQLGYYEAEMLAIVAHTWVMVRSKKTVYTTVSICTCSNQTELPNKQKRLLHTIQYPEKEKKKNLVN